MSVRRSAVAAVVGLACLAAAAAPAAHAAFPGRNGDLAVAYDTCEFSPHVRTLTVGGRDLGPVTPPCEVVGTDEEEEPIVRAAHSPEWSPDGRRLLFHQHGVEPAGLYTAAPEGSDARPIPGTRGAYDASFAPDGRRLVFMEDGAVHTIRLDGTGRRLLRLPASCPRNRGNCTYLHDPRWSPDGRRIAIVAEQFAYGPGRPPTPLPGIWLLDARTGRMLRRVVRSDGIRTPSDVDWSPDGRRLLFRTPFEQDEIRGGASGGNIYVVRTDGRARRRLVHRARYAETVPRWSPDGRWIAWIGLSFTGGDVAFDVTPTVYGRRVAGGPLQRVRTLPRPYVEEAEYFAPQLAWQPLPPAR